VKSVSSLKGEHFSTKVITLRSSCFHLFRSDSVVNPLRKTLVVDQRCAGVGAECVDVSSCLCPALISVTANDLSVGNPKSRSSD
jgi:hypothetical protein